MCPATALWTGFGDKGAELKRGGIRTGIGFAKHSGTVLQRMGVTLCKKEC
jgi:hypothetical protein